MKTKSLCGAVNLLAAIFGEDAGKLKLAYNLVDPCPVCGKPLPLGKEVCSWECKKKRKHIKIACSNCGKLFNRRAKYVIYKNNHANKLTGKSQELWFCNRKCHGLWVGKNYGFGIFPEHSFNSALSEQGKHNSGL